jgi:flagellar motor switch/type III secretory pathway protein FliN
MTFSVENLLANVGVRLGGLSLTVADVERYGPGVVLDFTPPPGGRVLVWVE